VASSSRDSSATYAHSSTKQGWLAG
jgi:hypothetical protein